MKKALLVSGLILGLGLSTAGMAAPQEDGHHHRAGGQTDHLERMARHLELSDTQRQEIRAAMEAHGPELRDLHSQIRNQRKALREEARNGFNEEATRELANTLGDLAGEAAFVATRMQSDIRMALTNEQREKLAERADKRRDRHMNHRHGHGRKTGEESAND